MQRLWGFLANRGTDTRTAFVEPKRDNARENSQGVAMKSFDRALLALGAAGFVAGAIPLVLALAGDDGHQRELIAVCAPLTGWAFIGTGIFAWLRRPENAIGALMTAVGFSACLAALRVSSDPWIFVVGLLFITLQWAVLFHLLLAFPGGTLRGRLDRLLAATFYVSAVVVHPVQTFFQDTGGRGLPENPLLISAEPDLTANLTRLRFAVGLVLLACLAAILVSRWRAARGSQRRAYAPVLASGGLVMGLLGLWYAAVLAELDPALVEALEEARIVVLATVPFAFLAGLLRSRVAGATAVSELVSRLGDSGERRRGLRDALADALGDPSLALAYWLPERREYVDADGRRVELPVEGSGRICTPVDSSGERVAAILHDESLANERELVRAVGAAAALTLENERLGAELRAKVEELSASRTRIVESSDAARRRLERDLHDGAQQRLVSLALGLRVLRSRLEGHPDAARELELAREELALALDELRELARGIHPSVLSDHGLDAALAGLADRAPLPVELEATPSERLPERVESAAYFVVAETLTNVAKYARATHASVNVTREDGQVLVEVSDDGIGGADPTTGSGLRGLHDRVSALDGGLVVDSRPGRGTTVRATIPVGEAPPLTRYPARRARVSRPSRVDA
jgi:signal transduction histidine kinase